MRCGLSWLSFGPFRTLPHQPALSEVDQLEKIIFIKRSFCSLIPPKTLSPTYVTTERAQTCTFTLPQTSSFPDCPCNTCTDIKHTLTHTHTHTQTNTHTHTHTHLYLSTHINYMGITETWFCSVRDVTGRA